MDQLNPQQRKAVETIDGPVLVVAGPGTGKTQLLSLRVVNILKNRDVSPENILCLTFTDAGSQEMSKRLVTFIGKAAYEVRTNTFHAFASYLQSRYIEYFDRSPFDSLITDLQASKLLSKLLLELSISDPLYEKPNMNGVSYTINEMKQFIGKIKKSSLTTVQLRSIIQQSLDTMIYLRDKTELVNSMLAEIPRDTDKKIEFCDDLKAKAARIFKNLPAELTQKRVALPGSYEPYGQYLARRFEETDWYEGAKTTGFRNLRESFFDKKKNDFHAREKNRFLKMQSALKVYEKYQSFLVEQGLFDFDDMILDAVAAIEKSEELRSILQTQYRYILIDEFQDTNGSQMRIVELLTEGLKSPNIMAVGDDDQAIMRFQGASVVFLEQFEDNYQGTARIVLQTNYRSTPSLVKLGQDVSQQIVRRSAASRDEKVLVANKKENSPKRFNVRSYATQELQYFDVARSIKQRMDEGFIRNAKKPQEAIAVIAWKRTSLAALIPYLKMFGVDFTYDVLSTVNKTEALQSFLATLHYVAFLAVGDEARADPWLAQVLAAPELGVPEDEYVHFALEANRNKRENRKGWTSSLAQCESPGLARLRTWLSQACAYAAASSAQRALHFLAKPFVDYYQRNAQTDPFAIMEFNYGLSAFLNFVEDERKTGGNQKHAAGLMKLADVNRLLEEAEKFDVAINVEVPISRPEAAALKTAHKSKGLEYDLVYLIDVDEASWHGRAGRPGIVCPNIYLNESRDEDDMRRLLFVALTRARSELEMSLGKSGIVGELLDNVDEQLIELPLEEISSQSMALWEESYYPNNQSLKDLITSVLAEKRLSASLLNSFVKYNPEEPGDGKGFVLKQVFNFPQAPVSHFEFGTTMHTYLELYLNHVIKAQDMTADELLERMHNELDGLDFEEAEIASMHERLDLIAQVFIPQIGEYANKDTLSEQWLNAVVDGVPLVGRSDLLVFDNKNKTIRVCDWKTGSKDRLDDAYQRQLVFYKLLVEESGLYPGWSVAGSIDIFIEPDFKTRELTPARFEDVPDEDVEHVRNLIQAVYWRIQNADFDTSAFDPADFDKKELQRAFEEWLIADCTDRKARG